MDNNKSSTPSPLPAASPTQSQAKQATGPVGPSVKLKNTGIKPHHLHDGTLLVPGHVTEVPGDTVAQLKAAKFGKTGKTSWEVLLESGLEETDQDTTWGKESAGDILAPPATSHLEQEENRLPYNPESEDPKWQSGTARKAGMTEEEAKGQQHSKSTFKK